MKYVIGRVYRVVRKCGLDFCGCGMLTYKIPYKVRCVAFHSDCKFNNTPYMLPVDYIRSALYFHTQSGCNALASYYNVRGLLG